MELDDMYFTQNGVNFRVFVGFYPGGGYVIQRYFESPRRWYTITDEIELLPKL